MPAPPDFPSPDPTCPGTPKKVRGRRGNAPPLPDEIVFSVIQKKVLTPSDFPGTGTLSHALMALVNRYNRTARPFKWKFTADDLTALLRRISQHEQAAATVSQAA
jgi:hypothetical protein